MNGEQMRPPSQQMPSPASDKNPAVTGSVKIKKQLWWGGGGGGFADESE